MSLTRPAPRLQVFPRRAEFVDMGVPVAVGDEDMAVCTYANIGGMIKGLTICRMIRPAYGHHMFISAVELVDAVAIGIDNKH